MLWAILCSSPHTQKLCSSLDHFMQLSVYLTMQLPEIVQLSVCSWPLTATKLCSRPPTSLCSCPKLCSNGPGLCSCPAHCAVAHPVNCIILPNYAVKMDQWVSDLHWTRKEEDSDRYGCCLCPQAPGTYPLWIRRLSCVSCSKHNKTRSFQDHHTLPKRNIPWKAVIVACSPFRTSTPSQREIFSQNCHCGLLVWSFLQDQHTLPKWNILSKLLLWLALCICISGSAHPPKVKYSLKLLLWLALSARMYVLVFQDQHTLPKWIFSLKTIIVACSVYLHSRTSTPSQSERAVIVACSYGVSFQALHTLPKRDTVNLTVCEILIFASMRSCPSLEKTHWPWHSWCIT